MKRAYANDTAASNGVSEYGTQVMAQGDKTHSNKLGGFLTSAMIAQQLQNMDLTISPAVKMPSQVAGNNPDGQQTFTVNGKNELKAYIKNADGNYTKVSEYWTKYGQTLITEIGEKHEELSKPSEPDTPSEEQGNCMGSRRFNRMQLYRCILLSEIRLGYTVIQLF